jgi:hypothetical protein
VGDIDDAIASARPIIDALETVRTQSGTYPVSLPVPAVSATHTGALDWIYRRTTGGTDYGLYADHNGWVSSFNWLVYSPDGQYENGWLTLRYKQRNGWLYVIGASDLSDRW